MESNIEELKKSLKKIGPLNKVVKSKDGAVIDGLHRLRADPNWPTIQLDEINTEEKKIIARLTLNWKRRKVRPDEIRRELTRLCELNKDGWKGHFSRNIAEQTGFNIDTVEKYLPDEYKQVHVPRPLVLDLSKGREYVKLMLLKHRDVWNIKEWMKPAKGVKVPMTSEHDRQFTKYHYNIWEAEPERPKGYGDASFHGNTSPEVAREIIVRYAPNKTDLVLDNMAGSGTILDMCKKLNRRCISYDISPIRPEIKQGDARKLDLPDNHVDFAFSHFPYGDMEKYTDLQGELSNMSPKQFLEESKKVMIEVHRILKAGCYYVVLIGDQRRDKKVIDWCAEFSVMGRKLFTLHDKIIWYAKGQTAYRGNDKLAPIAAEHNFYLPTFDTLLVFKK